MMLKNTSFKITLLSLLAMANSQLAQAQQITIDGDTATIVTQDGNKFIIDGNTLSGDGKNLFHSLREFGLSSGQIAEFITNPSIQNILTRVTGGNPSYINGLIQVAGGNSNLFIMNPAGMIFGDGASLNVLGDFTATTSTGIGFANGMFNAIGTNDYQTLTGDPTNFVFNTNDPGSLINTGNLAVTEGQNLTFVAGNVINTGTIETGAGKINIQAVEGTSRVKITPEGSLLSLEIDVPQDQQGNLLGFTPQDLPTLLTGGNNAGVPTTGVTVSSTTGNAEVGGVDRPNESGITLVSGKLDASSDNAVGGEITVLGNKVALVDAEINANGLTGGGEIKVGGDFQGNGTIPNSSLTIGDGNTTIRANATDDGDGGEVIIWSDGNTIFNGNIEAKGGSNTGDGGFVEISGKQNLAFNGQVDTTAVNGATGTLLLDPENITILNGDGTVDAEGNPYLDAEGNPLTIADNRLDEDVPEEEEEGVILNDDVFFIGDPDTSIEFINNFNITEQALEGLSGTTNVILEATNNITIDNLADNELTFAPNVVSSFQDQTSITFRADADNDGVGNFFMNADDSIIANGRDLEILGANITVGGIDTSALGDAGLAGDISLRSPLIDGDTDTSITIDGEINGGSLSISNVGVGGIININSGIVTTTGTQIYFDDVVFNSPTNSTTLTGETIIFVGTLSSFTNGEESLVVNAFTVFDTNDSLVVENNQALANLIINGDTLFELDPFINFYSINTTGEQIYNGNVFIGPDFDIEFNGQDITFQNQVLSFNFDEGEGEGVAPSSDLIINGTTGITFNGAVGETTSISDFLEEGDIFFVPFASLTTNGTTNINGGSITTIGDQIYNGDVIIGDNLNLQTTDNGVITFANTVNSETGESNNLTLNSGTGNLTFNGAVGNNQALGNINANTTGTTSFNNTVNANSLITNPGGTTELTGNVTTTENQIYGDEVNILNSIQLTNNQGQLEFQEDVNVGVNNLILSSLTGIELGENANLNGTGNLTIQTSTGDRNIILGEVIPGVSNPFIIGNLAELANSFSSLTIGNSNITNTITVNEILTVQNPLTLQASEIFVNQAINGLDNASITLRGDGNTTTLNADITTEGQSIVIEDNVIIGNDVTLNSNGGLIDVDGSINSLDGENNSLTVDAGSSNFNLTGNIGDLQPLNNLLVTASETILNSSQIQTIGFQQFNSDLFLLNDATQFNSGSTFASGSISSRGGELNINSEGDITVSYIDTSNLQGQGGDVTIATLGNLQITGTIPETNISINAAGADDDQSGTILIDFFPNGLENLDRLPFRVDTSIDEDTNGTAGIITNGISTVESGSYFTTIRKEEITVRLLESNDIDDQEKIETKPDSISLQKPPQSFNQIDTVREVQDVLTAIEEELQLEKGEAEKPALIYVSFTPQGYQARNLDDDLARRELTSTQEYSKVGITPQGFQPTFSIEPQDDDILDILVVTTKGEPVRVTVPVTRKEVVENAENFWIAISDVFALDDSYRSSASQLYSWLIEPLEAELEEREITNLVFILPSQIRFIPFAALYDEQEGQFLVEKYSSGLAPSLNLNNNDYRSIRDLKLLAMGASEFADSKVVPLPAASLELPLIQEIWNEEPVDDFQPYINENFKLEQIKANVGNQPYGIIHFGTHGDFNPDANDESYIQLYDDRLKLDDLRQLGLNEPLVELMVLSACETAFGDEIAELGFAGIAVKAGVKSAMGSVWQVSDTGTLALMTDFYRQLKTQPTKAQALRQAQLNLLNKNIYKTEDGDAIVTPERTISLEQLPEESRQVEDFSHPFYWAPFTMIGSPW